MAGSSQDDRLMVALHDGSAYVQVCGRGTFKVSSALKEFGVAALKSDCGRIVLDMSHCVGMDSTFMGVLAGLAAQLNKLGAGRLILLNLSDKTRGLLSTLGLDQVVEAHLVGGAPEALQVSDEVMRGMKALRCGDDGRAATAETMLEAHENLVSMSPENYPRFKDVLQFLREDLEKAAHDESHPPRGKAG